MSGAKGAGGKGGGGGKDRTYSEVRQADVVVYSRGPQDQPQALQQVQCLPHNQLLGSYYRAACLAHFLVLIKTWCFSKTMTTSCC